MPASAPCVFRPAPFAAGGGGQDTLRARSKNAAWPVRLVVFSLVFLASAPVLAEDSPAQMLHAVEQQLTRSQGAQDDYARQADAFALELATLRADSVDAAEKTQRHEAALSELENQLGSLTADEAQTEAALVRDRAREAQLLAALERLSLDPPEALAFGPAAPADMVRSGILLGAAVPRLEGEARSLRVRLAALQRLRAEIARKQTTIAAEREQLEQQQARLDALIARKSALREQALKGARETGERMTKLSVEAGDLRELIEHLDAERRAREAEAQRQAARREAERQARLAAMPRIDRTPPGVRPPEAVMAPEPLHPDPTMPKSPRSFATAHGLMVFPVTGTLLQRYGEPNEFGVSNKGLTLVTRPGALVVAPFDGRIEFAGPFKGYGQILIIQHRDGYHSLLAGLGRIDGAAGEWLVAGEPVGAMAPDEPKPRLYLELRHNGQPINPLPWLATRDEKVSG